MAVGTCGGERTATDKGRSIVTGSHIDTVRQGGRLDGALGIVAGLSAVEALVKRRASRGARSKSSRSVRRKARASRRTLGLPAIIGAIDSVDAEIGAAMRERGRSARIATAARDDIDTFVELAHRAGRGPRVCADATRRRERNRRHCAPRGDGDRDAPTMPGRPDGPAGRRGLRGRRDGTSNRVDRESLGKPAVATVGRLAVEPDQIMSSRARWSSPLTCARRPGRPACARGRIRSLCTTISQERRLGLAIRTLQKNLPWRCHPDVAGAARARGAGVGVQPMEMVSGAGTTRRFWRRGVESECCLSEYRGTVALPRRTNEPRALGLGLGVGEGPGVMAY